MNFFDFYWWTHPNPKKPPECPRCLLQGWFLFTRKGDGVCSACTGHEKLEDVDLRYTMRAEHWNIFKCLQIRKLQSLWGEDLHPELLKFLEDNQLPPSPNSEHVGEEKSRVILQLQYKTKEGPFDGDYGESYKYVFLEGGKNRVIWFTKATNWIDEVKPGTEFIVKATIGEHGEFKGIKETKVKRVKREQVDG